MPAFNFRLQKLLDAAAHMEAAARHELGRAQRLEAEAQAEWRRLVCLAARHQESLCGATAGGGPLGRGLARVEDLLGGCGLSERKAGEATGRAESARRVLTDAARWRKSLERLREGCREQHLAAEQDAEGKEQDDLVTVQSVARRSRGE